MYAPKRLCAANEISIVAQPASQIKLVEDQTDWSINFSTTVTGDCSFRVLANIPVTNQDGSNTAVAVERQTQNHPTSGIVWNAMEHGIGTIRFKMKSAFLTQAYQGLYNINFSQYKPDLNGAVVEKQVPVNLTHLHCQLNFDSNAFVTTVTQSQSSSQDYVYTIQGFNTHALCPLVGNGFTVTLKSEGTLNSGMTYPASSCTVGSNCNKIEFKRNVPGAFVVRIEARTNSSFSPNPGPKDFVVKVQCAVDFSSFTSSREMFVRTPGYTNTLNGFTWPSTCPVNTLSVRLKSEGTSTQLASAWTFPSTQCSGSGYCSKIDLLFNQPGTLKLLINVVYNTTLLSFATPP